MYEENSDISIIRKANDDMLAYFTENYNTKLDSIQALKTELFEINIKLDELNKTKSLYVFTSNSRKNVFSPIISDKIENEKEAAINSQIDDLLVAKSSLETKIARLDIELRSIKSFLTELNKANASIQTLSDSAIFQESPKEEDEEGFQFVEDQATPSDISSHGPNILMLEAFDKTYIGTVLDTRLKQDVINNRHKLEILQYLISSDPERAKLTVNEIIANTDKMTDSVDSLLKKLYYDFDSNKPIWMMLDNFVMDFRDQHPECVLEADIQCTDYEQNINYIKSLSLMMLLDIFFDNIIKHSNANRVTLRILVSETTVDVFINDDGVGISGDYYTKSAWYSGLHKAHEILYLLDGTLTMDGSYTEGTTVRFSFSAL